jgi:hypothetical protein
MKRSSPTGRRNHGRPLRRLLDTWDRHGSTSGPTPWQIDDDIKLVFYCVHLWSNIMLIHLKFKPNSYIYLLPFFYFQYQYTTFHQRVISPHVSNLFMCLRNLSYDYRLRETFTRDGKCTHYLQGWGGTVLGERGVVGKGGDEDRVKYTAFEMWWHTCRNRISSFGEKDESI